MSDSGTVSGTSLFHVAGFGPLAVTGIADIAKATVGPLLAGRNRPVLAAFAGGAAIAGHNWSPFLQGAGGRGFAPSLGRARGQRADRGSGHARRTRRGPRRRANRARWVRGAMCADSGARVAIRRAWGTCRYMRGRADVGEAVARERAAARADSRRPISGGCSSIATSWTRATRAAREDAGAPAPGRVPHAARSGRPRRRWATGWSRSRSSRSCISSRVRRRRSAASSRCGCSPPHSGGPLAARAASPLGPAPNDGVDGPAARRDGHRRAVDSRSVVDLPLGVPHRGREPGVPARA